MAWIVIAGLFSLNFSDCSSRSRQRLWSTYAIWFAASMPLLVATRALQASDVDLLPVLDLPARLLVVGDALAHYVTKVLWPMPLLVDYGRTPDFVLAGTPQGLIALVVAVLLIVAGWSLLRGERKVALGLFVFVGALAPHLGLVPFAFQSISTVADRYGYMAMLGVSMLTTMWVVAMSRRWPRAAWGSVGACGLLGILSWEQAATFRDTEKLFTHVLLYNPRSYSAHNNLGVTQLQQGKLLEGVAHLRLALELRPSLYKTADNIGVGLQKLGRIAESIPYHQRAISVEPRDSTAHVNLAETYRMKGERQAAAAAYAEALRHNPNRSLNRC